MGEIEPTQLGLRFNPPTFLLRYKVTLNAAKVTHRVRSMPIRNLSKTTDCYARAADLQKKHEKWLKDVPKVRIEKILRILQETMKGLDLEAALKRIKADFAINFDEDMNKLDDVALGRRKELMDLTFKKKEVKVGDPDFVYDKQVRGNF